ncbi:type II restriction/modification system DNA methylase subunit YeeA [Psychrobacter sp. PL15]|uniref:BREX-1 system adenine-specific DNA-methyltransferase PglX n=1 Tax=Psychrobacter sp. PL15 TaxID=3071719 RepID=UPI002E06284B|nr:type II restriction/modification system DNA methylase subunit YeeA [Psychrobacter sp. PL15]
METSNIKSYAPKARMEFIDAVAKRLNTFGISVNKKGELQVTEAIIQGSVLQIGDNNFDSSLAQRRQRLVERSQQLGYEQLVEQVAYTWFNRLSAIRYMEIHGYLGHGFRVLSHPSGEKQFEIIDHAQDAAEELGLDRNHIIDLKLAGNKNEELYRELLLGQCHKLHEAMPFLFEALNDEIELLLPDNLTRTDSILRGLVDSIPEEDWQQVEIIGWLYQFYISDKKYEVSGKVVKSEDIPAATQLFTPNWIVKYLVQNSVGRHWLQTYPDSPIKAEMEYYIEPAEQTEEVNQQLKDITPESIDPETIKVLDPASGSGHILIEAYNVLKAIYEERGYRSRDIPKLILEKNIYGLDIDDRAAQLSGFSLMMMARQDDRRIFSRDVRLNVLSLQETVHLDLPKLWQDLNLSGDWTSGATQDMFGGDLDLSSFGADNRYQLLQRNIERFKQAKTFGSLIEVPAAEYEALKELHDTVLELSESGDSIQRAAASQVIDVVHQALLLSIRYDAVVANPPYMGSKGMNSEITEFAKKNFPDSKSDLFAMFMERAFSLLNKNGLNAQINMHNWMFLPTFEDLRKNILSNRTIETMMHLGTRAFTQISGEVVQTTAWVIKCIDMENYKPTFFKLTDGNEYEKKTKILTREGKFNSVLQSEFDQIPGSPVAYWISKKWFEVFVNNPSLGAFSYVSEGIKTGNNNKFLRYWYEVDFRQVGDLNKANVKWVYHHKGGELRKWFGNREFVILWEGNGKVIKGMPNSGIQGEKTFYQDAAVWSDVTTKGYSARLKDRLHTFDSASPAGVTNIEVKTDLLCFLNSCVVGYLTPILNPTQHFKVGNFRTLPFKSNVATDSSPMIRIAKQDWDFYEYSWDFTLNPIMKEKDLKSSSLVSKNYASWRTSCNKIISSLQNLEEVNNKTFINAYNLNGFLDPEVKLSNITLTCNPEYKYGVSTKEADVANKLTSNSIAELISYTVGCMMGRYSLDQEGLIYAHAGNEDFDASLYKTFPADSDGIIPLSDEEWFKDDISNRVVEFVKTVWSEGNLTENLQFIADSLCLDAIRSKNSESAAATIRRYLSMQFYKHHMQTYKNRPIYWLFSSGKEKAFECLVYLHRYNESTLSRMRTEYVTPLLGKYQAYAEQLDKQIDMAESTPDKKRLERELKSMDKKQSELREFDDKLKHYADMRISIDLDDGVKENYGKFGDLLAEVKKITGEKPEIINAN